MQTAAKRKAIKGCGQRGRGEVGREVSGSKRNYIPSQMPKALVANTCEREARNSAARRRVEESRADEVLRRLDVQVRHGKLAKSHLEGCRSCVSTVQPPRVDRLQNHCCTLGSVGCALRDLVSSRSGCGSVKPLHDAKPSLQCTVILCACTCSTAANVNGVVSVCNEGWLSSCRDNG